jgi:hypothetical protein
MWYFSYIHKEQSLQNIKKSFEHTKGVIRIHIRRRTDNTMSKRKKTKGQTTIYKTYTKNKD